MWLQLLNALPLLTLMHLGIRAGHDLTVHLSILAAACQLAQRYLVVQVDEEDVLEEHAVAVGNEWTHVVRS